MAQEFLSHPLSPGLGRGGVPRPRQTLSGLPLMPGSPLGQAGLSKLVWGYLSGRNHGNLQPGNPSWWALPSSPVGFSTGLLPCLALSSYLLPGNLILLILEGEIPSPATPPTPSPTLLSRATRMRGSVPCLEFGGSASGGWGCGLGPGNFLNH